MKYLLYLWVILKIYTMSLFSFSKDKRQVRVFISSTFRDMQEERDYLIKKIFPQVRNHCTQKGISFTEVDLRWGITEEESQNGKVAEICLHEIERTRPFFIGLLGDRYGWIPSLKDNIDCEHLIQEYPWIEQDIDEGLSITEIEMQYGVLRCKHEMDAVFMFRDPVVSVPEGYKEVPNSVEAKKLDCLKREISSQNKYPVYVYQSVEHLGKTLLNILFDLVDKKFPEESLSDFEQEHIVQQSYVNDRSAYYVELSDYMKQIDEFAHSNESILLIHGESGSGKSALLANYIYQCQQTNPQLNLFFHFPGCGMNSNHTEVLQRLINEISFKFAGTYPTSNQPAADKNDISLRHELEFYLNIIPSSIPCFIILDALNQITVSMESKQLQWLPELPPNVKIVASAISDTPAFQILKNRNVRMLEISPMNIKERERLTTTYLGLYGKKISTNLLKEICADKKSGNPLFLSALLNELRIFGIHETLNETCNTYLQSVSIAHFFSLVLQRMEQEYDQPDTPFIKQILSSLTFSIYGLTEHELKQMTGITNYQWSAFFYAFSDYFIIKKGRINIAHSYLIKAIQERYLGGSIPIEEWGSKTLRRELPQEYQLEINKLIEFYEEKANKIDYDKGYGDSLIYFQELGNLYYTLRDAPKLYAHLCKFRVMYYFTTMDNLIIKYIGFLNWCQINDLNNIRYDFSCFLKDIPEFTLKDQFILTRRLITLEEHIGQSSNAMSFAERCEVLLNQLNDYEPTYIDYLTLGKVWTKNILTYKKGKQYIDKGLTLMREKRAPYTYYCDMYLFYIDIFLKAAKTDKALQHINWGIDLLKQYNALNSIYAARFYNKLAHLHASENHKQELNLYIDKAEELFLRLEGEYSVGLAENYYIRGSYLYLLEGEKNYDLTKIVYSYQHQQPKNKIKKHFEQIGLAQLSAHETSKMALEWYVKSLKILDVTTGLNTEFAENILVEMKVKLAQISNQESEYYTSDSFTSQFDTLPHSKTGKNWEYLIDETEDGWKNHRKGCILLLVAVIGIITLIITLFLWVGGTIAEWFIKLIN